MAQIANMTVKKFDGVTDILWTGVQGSGGDKSPAIWTSDTVSTSRSFRPTLQQWSFHTGNSQHRASKVTLVYPSLYIENGVTKVLGFNTFSGEFKTLMAAPSTDVQETVAQTINLMASAHLRAHLISGYAPT